MGVPEAFQRTMGIIVIVRVRMVLNVGGGPVEGRALHGHRATDEKEGFQPGVSLKTFMSEHPMIPNRNAVATKGKEGEEEGNVHPGNIGVPEKDDGGDDAENRKPN